MGVTIKRARPFSKRQFLGGFVVQLGLWVIGAGFIYLVSCMVLGGAVCFVQDLCSEEPKAVEQPKVAARPKAQPLDFEGDIGGFWRADDVVTKLS